MKAIISVTVLLFLFSCKKEDRAIQPEAAVSKKITYHVFAAKDYSAPEYQPVDADLRLQIRVVNYKTGEQTLVWDSVFSTRKLMAFPLYSNKLVVEKSFPVFNSYQKLNGSYSVRYNNLGLISQEAKSDEAVPGRDSVLLEADL